MDTILKTGVPQINHFIIEKKRKINYYQRSHFSSPQNISKQSGCDAFRASGCGEDQKAGEGVARAALTHKGVEPGDLQWHCVSGLQLQYGWTGRNQKTLRWIALCQLYVAAFH